MLSLECCGPSQRREAVASTHVVVHGAQPGDPPGATDGDSGGICAPSAPSAGSFTSFARGLCHPITTTFRYVGFPRHPHVIANARYRAGPNRVDVGGAATPPRVIELGADRLDPPEQRRGDAENGAVCPSNSTPPSTSSVEAVSAHPRARVRAGAPVPRSHPAVRTSVSPPASSVISPLRIGWP
jgi:hypothetical protein